MLPCRLRLVSPHPSPPQIPFMAVTRFRLQGNPAGIGRAARDAVRPPRPPHAGEGREIVFRDVGTQRDSMLLGCPTLFHFFVHYDPLLAAWQSCSSVRPCCTRHVRQRRSSPPPPSSTALAHLSRVSQRMRTSSHCHTVTCLPDAMSPSRGHRSNGAGESFSTACICLIMCCMTGLRRRLRLLL